MRSNVIIPGLLLVSATIGGAAILHAIEPKPAVAAATQRTPQEEGPKIATGEASRATRGNLAIYIPSEITIRRDDQKGPVFDLVVHFHGTAKNQENNIDEAKLPAAVVSVNEGVLSDSYGKAWSAPKAIDRVIKFAEQEVGKRESGAKVGRIALSSWSAGGASVKNILQNDADRPDLDIDAVILADGVFSTWEDQKEQVVRRAPLAPIIKFGQKALNGEKLMIITHTAIPTEYPSVEKCTEVVLDALDLQKGEPAVLTQPAGGSPTYAVDRGGFHVRGVDGTGPQDHIAQIRSLDDAYAELRRRWNPER